MTNYAKTRDTRVCIIPPRICIAFTSPDDTLGLKNHDTKDGFSYLPVLGSFSHTPRGEDHVITEKPMIYCCILYGDKF